MSRSENVALRALTSAMESHTELVRQIIGRLDTIDAHLGTIDGHLGTLVGTVAEHIAEHRESE